jgi:preprotein translocase subunit Sec61beta
MMRRRSSFLLACVLALAPLAATAADTPAAAPTAAPAPSAAEAAFLKKVMTELPKRYPTAQAATKAGYVRYTNEDETGAISYVNTAAWDTTDANVPAQLWYDVKGRLIGADFSVRRSADATPAPKPARPSLFGIDPTRVITIGAHVHYVTCDKTSGKCVYGKAVGAKKYATVGDVEHPTADGLVKVGAVKDAASVSAVFLYPAIYDVPVWLVPNPLGQFADKNPSVTPSPNAGKGEDDPM